MADIDDIVEYIQECRKRFQDAEIRQELLNSGVDAASIDRAFALVSSGIRAPGPAPVRPSGPPPDRRAVFFIAGILALIGFSLIAVKLFTASSIQDLAATRDEAAAGSGEKDRGLPAKELGDAAAVRPDIAFGDRRAALSAAQDGIRRIDKAKQLLEVDKTMHWLGQLRVALSIYYGDEPDKAPEDLAGLVPKYISSIPEASTGVHPKSAKAEIYDGSVCTSEGGYANSPPKPEGLRDTGRWGYIYDPGSPCHGQVFIDCTHEDPKGRLLYKL